jgi:hypothetical protein
VLLLWRPAKKPLQLRWHVVGSTERGGGDLEEELPYIRGRGFAGVERELVGRKAQALEQKRRPQLLFWSDEDHLVVASLGWLANPNPNPSSNPNPYPNPNPPTPLGR